MVDVRGHVALAAFGLLVVLSGCTGNGSDVSIDAKPVAASESCPADAPYAGNPRWRPTGPAVTELTDVQSVTACTYADVRLRSSQRLNAEDSRKVVAAIVAAPEGGGPFNPAASCVPVEEEDEAAERLVLQIDAATDATVSLRFGCSSAGMDDGHTVRTLTRAAVQPFFPNPDQVTIQSWALESVLKR